MKLVTMKGAWASANQDGRTAFAESLINEKFDKGGLAELFEDNRDIDRACKINPRLSRRQLMADTALVLENERRALMHLNEVQRAVTLGGFQDYIFPVIRAAFPSNPIIDMVSVQPMTRRIGQVFFQHYKIAQTKGSRTAGSRLFDAFSGFSGGDDYSGEFINGEQCGTIGTGVATLTATLAYGSNDSGGGIRPGTVRLYGLSSNGADPWVAVDNGNGILLLQVAGGQTLTGTNTINYLTGAFTLTFNANPAVAIVVNADYEYDSEGSTNLPSVEIELASATVHANRRALRYRYSTEAAQDYSAEFGVDVDSDIARGISATITTEHAREVLRDLWNAAGPAFATFSLSALKPAGVTTREYYADLQNPLAATINQIYQETQRAQANWMVVDTNFKTVLDTIGAPHFAQWNEANWNNDELGVKFIGTWGGTVRVYVDSLLNQNVGASPLGNALLGFKGTDFKDAGYVWAPYRLSYMTPSTTLDDFITRRAMASRVGKKLINNRLFKRFALVA